MNDHPEKSNSGYETRDVNVVKVTAFIILGIIALAAILVSLDVYFTYAAEREYYEMVLKPESRILLEIRQRDSTILNSYGVLNGDSGVYHIPIDSAMKQMLAEEELSTEEK